MSNAKVGFTLGGLGAPEVIATAPAAVSLAVSRAALGALAAADLLAALTAPVRYTKPGGASGSLGTILDTALFRVRVPGGGVGVDGGVRERGEEERGDVAARGAFC